MDEREASQGAILCSAVLDGVKPARLVEALELVQSAVFELDPRAGDEIAHGGRDQHLAGICDGSHARTDVHRDAGQLVPDNLDLARMQAAANRDPEPANASSTATAQRIARAGPSKDARNPSPAVSISRPR